MAITKLHIHAFLESHRYFPTLDVRSPGEYRQAHIPGAHSFPLFNDEERAEIGTTYKQVSRDGAVKIGLRYFGKNLENMVEQAEKIIKAGNKGKEVNLHCWRGGMRSSAVAWLLDLCGYNVNLLAGGYKAFRRQALTQFENTGELRILGGYTGSNKTGLLELFKVSAPVINLEELAAHKGSAFGNLDNHPQPSQEHFENLLAMEIRRCEQEYPAQPIWLEGESQRLGDVNIPLSFNLKMKQSAMIFLNIPFEKRLNHIVKEYGHFAKEKLVNAALRIKKRLGGQECNAVVSLLEANDVKGAFAILLKYYDKFYTRTINDNEFKDRVIIHLDSETSDAAQNLNKLLTHVNG